MARDCGAGEHKAGRIFGVAAVIYREMHFGKLYFLVLCVMAIIVDPLFFYIPVLNDDNKCIDFDRNLWTTATVLRSVFDFLKLIHIICALCSELRENRRKLLRMFFLTDFLAILPIPQLMMFSLTIRAFAPLSAMSVLQYSGRVIQAYHLFTQATGVSGILAGAKWAIVAFNLFRYTYGGHVFGALWYFGAIEKVAVCWEKACINHSECSLFNCINHDKYYREWKIYLFSCREKGMEDNKAIGNNKILSDFCGIKTGNTTNYNFGLFNDAIQTGIMGVTDFPKKFLHCLQWGLQNLSAFGQNLQTSGDVWENIFAICMTNFGVLLFVFLIGNMQSVTARSQMIRQNWEEIKQWPNFRNISSDVQDQLRKYKRENWQETKRVDVGNLVSELPEELRNKIKRKLGLKLLKKVNEFGNWSEKLLGEVCDCLRPVFFVERTRIIREGDPIDEIIFVLRGKLWTYTSRNEATSSGLIDHWRRENHLKDGDVFGEELVAWAQNEQSYNLPISTKTIQATTNVEAFTLLADDLKHVLLLIHYDRAALFILSYWRFRRILRAKRNSQKKSRLGRKCKDCISICLWD